MTQGTPPGLEAVPVSCYSGFFRTWAFDNDIMAEFENSKVEESGFDDEFVPEECEDNSPKTEHFNIDTSPEKDHMHSDFDDRTFAEIGTRPKRLCR